MRKIIFIQSLFCLFFLASSQLMAQFPPRVEDHFWRRKVVNKIDLTEKVNQPLVMKESPLYNQYHTGMDKKGVVVALMEGLKAAKYIAYNTDSLDKSLDYNQVMSILAEARGDKKDTDAGAGGSGEDGEGFDDMSGDDAGADAGGGGTDEWGFGSDFGEEPAAAAPDGAISMGAGDEYAPLENYLLFVEDRIFDKNKSDMVYDIQYIQIYFVDPGGVLRDRAICTFKYNEVMDLLDNTIWKNKFNDAEYRSMREIFELRLFNSYIVNVSNINFGVNSLEEAQYRKEQLIEFEHNLWSY